MDLGAARAAVAELDAATVREAALLTAELGLSMLGWWLCGRGFHAPDPDGWCPSCGRSVA